MPLSEGERTRLKTHLAHPANLEEIKGHLKLGRGKLMEVKQENFAELKWWLHASLLIAADDEGVRQAAELVEEVNKQVTDKSITLEVAPPPLLNVVAEQKRVLDDCGHAKTIRGIYVQLDRAQNKHQPPGVPIGDRPAHGGEKFGSYATKEWHEANTMAYMADWAAGLTGMVEGKKVEHGQLVPQHVKGVGPVSFEGFCVLLGGKKYVSFHCYPNNR